MSIKTMITGWFKKTGDRIEENKITREEKKTTVELQKYVMDYQKIKVERDDAKINATKFRTILEKESTKISHEQMKEVIEGEQSAIKKFERVMTKQIWDLHRIILDLDKLIQTEFHETIVELERPLSAYNLVVEQFKESFEVDNRFIIPLNPSQRDTIYKHFVDMEKNFDNLVRNIIELLKIDLLPSADMDRITMANNMRKRSELRQRINRQTFAIRGKFSAISKEFRRIQKTPDAQTFEVLNGTIMNMEQQFNALLLIFEERRQLAKGMIHDSKRLRIQIITELKELDAIQESFYNEMKTKSKNISPEQNKTLVQLEDWKKKNNVKINNDISIASEEIDEEIKSATFTAQAVQEMQNSFIQHTHDIMNTLQTVTSGATIRTANSAIALVLAGIIAVEAIAIPAGSSTIPIGEKTRVVSAADCNREFEKAKSDAYVFGSEVTAPTDYNTSIEINKNHRADTVKMTYAAHFQGDETNFYNAGVADSLGSEFMKSLEINNSQIQKQIESHLNKFIKDNKLDINDADRDSLLVTGFDALVQSVGLDSLMTGTVATIESSACIFGTGSHFNQNLSLPFKRAMKAYNEVLLTMIQKTTDNTMKKVLENMLHRVKIIPSILVGSNQIVSAMGTMNSNEHVSNKFTPAEKELLGKNGKAQEQMNNFVNTVIMGAKTNEEVEKIVSTVKIGEVFSEDVILVLKKFDSNLLELKKYDMKTWTALKDKLGNDRHVDITMKLVIKIPLGFKAFKVIDKMPQDAILGQQANTFIPQGKVKYVDTTPKPQGWRTVQTRSGGNTNVYPGGPHFVTAHRGQQTRGH